MPYLVGVSDNFKNAVSKTLGFQTKEMKAVIQAVGDYQRLPNLIQFRSLREALATWQRTNPAEYTNRLSSIRVAFDGEMAAQGLLYGAAAAVVNNMTWVSAVAPRLEQFKEYAVGDILAFMGNSTAEARQDCLARYADFAHADPEPPRNGMRVAGVVMGTAWNENRVRMMERYVTYAATRTVHYTRQGNINTTPATGAGPITVQARGCAVCTEFAFAAAHVLTDGRPLGPRVEVVAWSGGGAAAHCFVIVGRQGGLGPQNLLPAVATWGPDCVIIDAWLAALGHKVAYRLAAGDYPYPYFLTPVKLVMVRP